MNFCKDCEFCYQETDRASMMDARFENNNAHLCTNEKMMASFNPVTGQPPTCMDIRKMCHPIVSYGHGNCTMFQERKGLK